MSEHTLALGEKFVEALIEEGNDYNSLKANFLYAVTKKGMAMSNFIAAELARKLKMQRNRVFSLLQEFPDLRPKRDAGGERA